MVFDKKRYWSNRKAGVRGQHNFELELASAPKAVEFPGVSLKPVSTKALRRNTKRARKAAAPEIAKGSGHTSSFKKIAEAQRYVVEREARIRREFPGTNNERVADRRRHKNRPAGRRVNVLQ